MAKTAVQIPLVQVLKAVQEELSAVRVGMALRLSMD